MKWEENDFFLFISVYERGSKETWQLGQGNGKNLNTKLAIRRHRIFISSLKYTENCI